MQRIALWLLLFICWTAVNTLALVKETAPNLLQDLFRAVGIPAPKAQIRQVGGCLSLFSVPKADQVNRHVSGEQLLNSISRTAQG